jgi:hypothetical protein
VPIRRNSYASCAHMEAWVARAVGGAWVLPLRESKRIAFSTPRRQAIGSERPIHRSTPALSARPSASSFPVPCSMLPVGRRSYSASLSIQAHSPRHSMIDHAKWFNHTPCSRISRMPVRCPHVGHKSDSPFPEGWVIWSAAPRHQWVGPSIGMARHYWLSSVVLAPPALSPGHRHSPHISLEHRPLRAISVTTQRHEEDDSPIRQSLARFSAGHLSRFERRRATHVASHWSRKGLPHVPGGPSLSRIAAA